MMRSKTRRRKGKNAAIVQPSCSEEFLQGKVFNGKYKVRKMIRNGRYSAIFSGNYGNQVVALKCLFPMVISLND